MIVNYNLKFMEKNEFIKVMNIEVQVNTANT